MSKTIKVIIRVFLFGIGLLLVTSCSSEDKSNIDPVTKMVTYFCPTLKEEVEKANSDFWSLGKKTSLLTLKESMFEVGRNAASISILAGPPAKTWLNELSVNAGDIVRYFSTPEMVTSEELLEIASRWKGTYEALPTYCK